MRRKKCGLMGRLYICWKPHPRGLERCHLSQVGDGGDGVWSPSPASIPGSARDKADTVRGAHGDVCPNRVTRPSLQDSGL